MGNLVIAFVVVVVVAAAATAAVVLLVDVNVVVDSSGICLYSSSICWI